MEYFREAACDIVVLEVGMGGSLDSTNVIAYPEVAVITNIGLEQTEYLGNTLSEIASAKGGIIKPDCAVVCYESAPEVTQTIADICAERGAIPAEARREKSAVICEKIRASRAYREASTILLFKAFCSEVDLSVLERFARQDGKTLLYPYCVGKHQMLALQPNTDSNWELDDYGIRVPILERSQMILPS